MSEQVLRLTPKGCITAAILARDDMLYVDATDVSETVLESLYRHAQARAEPGYTPGLAFVDGHWEFASLGKQESP